MRRRRSRSGLALAGLTLTLASASLAAPASSWGWYYYGYDNPCADAVVWEFNPPLKALPSSGTITINSRGTLRCAQAGATVYESPPQAYPSVSSYPAWRPTTKFAYFGNCAAAVLTGITHPGMVGELKGSTAYLAGQRDPHLVSTAAEVHQLIGSISTNRSSELPDVGELPDLGDLQCGAPTAVGYAVWNDVTGGRN